MRIVFVVAALGAWAALGTTVLWADVKLLTRTSDVVVLGRVTSSSARWTADGSRIVTETVVAVDEVWKGGALDAVTLVQPGGVVGDTGQKVEGTARFHAGEEVVLFLEARGPRFIPTGMAQGRFVVDRRLDRPVARQDQVEGLHGVRPDGTRAAASVGPLSLPLDELKAQVALVPARPGPVLTP